jgi:hypothetical protein
MHCDFNLLDSISILDEHLGVATCLLQSSHVAILLFEIQVLKFTPVPVVFASFSGGPKGCTYKVLQVNTL